MPGAQNVFYVPWPDKSEWNGVRDQIFSSNINEVIRAYEMILMWKLKYYSLPAYIESTYSLLQVMVKEYEMNNNKNSLTLFDEHDLQLSYSTALIRFVNHVSSISSYKGETMYLAAKTQNIPDWIINMRHNAAHGQDLPTLDALHVGAELSLKWLLDNYWANSENFTQSLDVSKNDNDSRSTLEFDINSGKLFSKVFEVWEYCNNFKQVKFIRKLDREFFLHVEEILNINKIYFHHQTIETTNDLQSVLQFYNELDSSGRQNSDYPMKVKEFKALLLKLLNNLAKSSDEAKHSCIMCLFETNFLSENFKPFDWKQILCLIQEIGMLSLLLKVLFQLAGKGHKGASKWLSVLSPSIRHLKKQWAMFKLLKKENNNFKTKQLKEKVQKTVKSTDPDLIVRLNIFKPPVVTLEMMETVLLNPELLSVKDIVQYLKLVKPSLSKHMIETIKDLVSLQVAEEMGSSENQELLNDKIFTVDDIKVDSMEEVDVIFEEAAGCDSEWRKSSIDIHSWSKCPLGLLPFQSRVNCELPNDLPWRRKYFNQKRTSIPLVKHSVNMKEIQENEQS